MISYNNSYNKMVSIFVIAIDTILCGSLFFLINELVEGKAWEKTMTAPEHQIILTLMLTYIVGASYSGVVLYQRKVYAFQIVTRIATSMGIFAVLSMLILKAGDYMDPWSYFYMTYLITLFIAIIIFRISLRQLIKWYRSRGGNIRCVVLLGSSKNMIELYRELTDMNWTGYRVLGYFDHQENTELSKECSYLGKPEETTAWLEQHQNTHYLYCSLPSKDKDIIVKIIDYCENHLVRFFSIPNIHNYLQNRMYLEAIGNVPYLALRKDPLSRTGNKILKRTFDFVVSATFLFTLFPFIFIIVAVVTKITMPGPIFFRQKRNGLNDEEFYCYKFRSMKVNADADKLQATKNDPRKTKWGNIMRKTNIDELPQFINVLIGDMSLVGPRPHMLKHTTEYSKLIDKYMVRHFVKPGITGWSQVTGFRGETKELSEMEGRIKGDIWYIEHWNFWLDIYIMIRTVTNVFVGEKKAY